MALLEELAADITGWRRPRGRVLPPPGPHAPRLRPGHRPALSRGRPGRRGRLQLAEGLVGSLTHTPLGGWADLRNAYGAQKAHTAFDEFHHTADFRRGRGQVGWHDIPRLGVFVWRLHTFGVFTGHAGGVQGLPGPVYLRSDRAGDTAVCRGRTQLMAPPGSRPRSGSCPHPSAEGCSGWPCPTSMPCPTPSRAHWRRVRWRCSTRAATLCPWSRSRPTRRSPQRPSSWTLSGAA